MSNEPFTMEHIRRAARLVDSIMGNGSSRIARDDGYTRMHPLGGYCLGYEVIQTAHIPITVVGHRIVEVRFTHSAKHRAWKRIVAQRRKLAREIKRRDALLMGTRMFIHPDDLAKLRRQT